MGGTGDYALVNFSQASGATTISFSRLLNTGDSRDAVISNTSMYLVYAYATAVGSGTTYPKHTATGSGLVNFLQSGNPSTPAVNLTGQTLATNNNSYLLQTISKTPQYASPSGAYKAWWSIDSSRTTANITMQCNTTGWVSIGFSDYPLMAPADVVVSGFQRFCVLCFMGS